MIMQPARRDSCEDISSPQCCSPMSVSSEEAPPNSNSAEEAVHYLSDFLDPKLADDTLISRLLLTSHSLQELDAKDVLEQELKMKQENAKMTTGKLPKVATLLNKGEPSSRRVPSPDAVADSKSTGRRCRTQFTPTQLDLLETTFQVQNYPSSTLRQQMHEMTGIPKDNIKVWFQNRRAREKRKKVRCQRRGLPSASDTSTNVTRTTTPSSSSSEHPVPMTIVRMRPSMHWPEDSTTETVSAPPPPRYHPYQPHCNPTTENRRKWYWANAYHPLESESSTSASMNSFSSASSNAMLSPFPHIPAVSGAMPTFARYAEPVSLPHSISPVAAESFVNCTSDMHPWSNNVLTSL